MTDPEIRWLRSYTEDVFLQVVPEDKLLHDVPDFFAFQDGPICGSVDLHGSSAAPLIRVFAIAARHLKRSAKLLNEINEINNSALGPSVYLCDDSVIVEMFIHAHGLDEATFEYAWNAITDVAQQVGPMLAAVYAGSVPAQTAQRAA